MHTISSYVNYKVKQIGKEILNGTISVNPCEMGSDLACTYCAYKSVCGYDDGTEGYPVRKLKKLGNEEVLERMREEV
ncbi:MAG: hypothetical protein K2N00_06800 [Lachnospiraceae bacterium]|nr:hypothetical protein [Lachnospiraceae bacterium]